MKIRRVCFDDGLEGRREIGSNKGSRPSLSAPIRSSPYKMQRVHRQTASNRPFQIRGHDNARATVAFSSPFARRYFIVAKKERRSEKSCSFPSFRVKPEFFFERFWKILNSYVLYWSLKETLKKFCYFCYADIQNCKIYGINIERTEEMAS